jgi:Putative prokaryotic signal transducing protein
MRISAAVNYDSERYVTVETFTSPWEAQLARARLESEGIESLVADEHLVRMDWVISRAIGGVKLKVRACDAERAAEALRTSEAIPEIHLVTEAEAACRRCPGCNSDNLTFERWSRLAFFGTWLLFGFPLPVPRNRWTCRHCGAVWREEELRGGGRTGGEDLGEMEEETMAAGTEDDETLDSLVTVARFPNPWEAHLARTRLEHEGLAACVLEERLPVVNLLSGELAALSRLAVKAGDADRAREILREILETALGRPAFEG